MSQLERAVIIMLRAKAAAATSKDAQDALLSAVAAVETGAYLHQVRRNHPCS